MKSTFLRDRIIYEKNDQKQIKNLQICPSYKWTFLCLAAAISGSTAASNCNGPSIKLGSMNPSSWTIFFAKAIALMALSIASPELESSVAYDNSATLGSIPNFTDDLADSTAF